MSKLGQKVKLLHLGVGVHSFGNQQSILAKPNKITMELVEHGVFCVHLELKRKALVPYSNIRAIEFAYDSDFNEEVVENFNEADMTHLLKNGSTTTLVKSKK